MNSSHKSSFRPHHLDHESGGNDSIKLDDLAAPDNNTDLNVSISTHGLCPLLPNDSTKYLDGTGSYVNPKLDNLSAPDNNTDLNATASAHGLLMQLSNDASQYLDGTGNWINPKLDNLSAPDDNPDLNATNGAHGLLMKLDNQPLHYLTGEGKWEPATPSGHHDSHITGSDIIHNATVTTPGFLSILSNDADEYMNGQGAWTSPPSSLTGLTDGPGTMVGASGQFLMIDGDENSFSFQALSEKASLVTTVSGEFVLWSKTLSENNTYTIEAGVQGSDAGEFINNSYIRSISASRNGGGITLSDPDNMVTNETLPCSCRFVTSGVNTINLVVSPPTTLTTTWKADVKVAQLPHCGVDSTITYRLPLNTSGYKNLPDDWAACAAEKIGATTVNPTLRYEGNDARAAGWTAKVGNTLTLTGAGTAPTYDEPTPFTDGSLAVYQKGGKYWQDSTTTFADITTADFWWQIVFKTPATGSVVIFAKRNAGVGYEVGISAGLNLYFTISDGVTTKTITSTSALVANTWVEAEGFYRYSHASGLQMAICGMPGAANVTTVGVNSLTSTNKFTIGADSNGASIFTTPIGFVSLWSKASYITHAQIGAYGYIPQSDRIFGLWADVYPSSKDWPFRRFCNVTYSNVNWQGRASPAMVEVWDPVANIARLFYVYNGWFRIARWKQEDGKLFSGYHAESGITNLLLQNKDMSTTWTAVNGTNKVNTIAGPDDDSGQTTCDGFVPNTTNGVHGWTQATTIAALYHVFGCYAKKGNLNWLYLSDDTVNGAWAYFDLNTGVIGRTGTGITNASILPKGNGFYCCAIKFLGTVASHTFAVYTSDADYGTANPSFAGNNNDSSLYVTLAQCEARGSCGYTLAAPVITAAAQVTKTIDDLYYWAQGATGNSNLDGMAANKAGTASADLLLRKHDAYSAGCPIFNLCNAANNLFIKIGWYYTKKIVLRTHDFNNDYGINIENNGNPLRFYLAWSAADGKFYIYNNGIAQTAKSSVYTPSWDVDTIQIGRDDNTTYAANGLIRNVRFSDECRLP